MLFLMVMMQTAFLSAQHITRFTGFSIASEAFDGILTVPMGVRSWFFFSLFSIVLLCCLAIFYVIFQNAKEKDAEEQAEKKEDYVV